MYRLTPSQLEIYRKYANLALPRHTSYPIAPAWKDDYGSHDLIRDLATSKKEQRPLSLYVHVPFCRQLCYYCGCTKEIVPSDKITAHEPGDSYLAGVEAEVKRFAKVVGPGTVSQVHLGGGSPTFLTETQLEHMWGILSQNFHIEDDAEVAIEVDPRITSKEKLSKLKALGFNRISLGVQDFDQKVQEAVNRRQSYELVDELVKHARSLGFSSVNFDLIYGLPFQTLASMEQTLDQVIKLAPDRIAFYRLAMIPEIFKWQKSFIRTDMPSGDLPLALNQLGIKKFTAAGYEFIGLDHFAKPDEHLAKSAKDKSLRRTFQGMTTHKHLDILGIGPSAITQLDDAFAQNRKTSKEWLSVIHDDFATNKGLHLSTDDRIRREAIQQIYGHGILDKKSLEETFKISFDHYFADDLKRLNDLVKDGLVELTSSEVKATEPLGRLLVRVIASVFDAYLPKDAHIKGIPENRSSKVG